MRQRNHIGRDLSRTALAVAALLALASTAAAFTDLTVGRRLVARDVLNPKADRIVFRYINDSALFTTVNPLCPAQSSIRFVTDTQVLPEITLDCNDWKATPSGFKYKDNPTGPGSVIRIVYRPGKLIVKVKGQPYSADAVQGPVNFIETRVSIGGTDYCGRWEEPPSDYRRNFPQIVVAKGPTTVCQEVCGNSITEGVEECDDGNLIDGDGCDSNCTVTACGNGIITAPEECDDGNTVSGDGCSAVCANEVCGNGVVDVGEDCDDGNTSDGDCCSMTCGFETAGSACDDDANVCTDDVCDGAGTCEHNPNTNSCDDMNGCTTGDVCSGGTCQGTLLDPWINEIDYDDNAGFPNNDRDEFVEIAGPAGLDLSDYQVIVVEGAGGGCLTGFNAAGEGYTQGQIPASTVLGDDTGTGIGFLTVCFSSTSTNVSGCDVTLAGTATDSNLKNGNLTNTDPNNCPDGVLLLDPDDNYVDTVSYEGIVQNTGMFGPFFHVNTPYSAERDEGFLLRVSIEKTTSSLSRATSGSEWRDPSELGFGICQGQIGIACPNNTATPGAENPLQAMACGSPCAAFLDAPASIAD